MAIKTGTASNDTIYGTSSADELNGLAGSDRIYGNGGNDKIWGGDGDDGLWGQASDDTIWGGNGVDALFGDVGKDTLFGDAGNDYLSGGNDADVLWGGAGNDTLRGDAGDDRLDGGTGVDNLAGGDGNDLLVYGASGLVSEASSVFNGGNGTDTLLVNAANALIDTPNGDAQATVRIAFNDFGGQTVGFVDAAATAFVTTGTFSGLEKFAISADSSLVFSGGATNSTVTGGKYADTFASGSGSETFIGGGGADQFHFNTASGETDHIIGFDPTQDVVVTTLWYDSQFNEINKHSVTESNGHTYVTTTNFAGDVIHTMDFDTVGIPETVFRSGYDWS